MRISDQNIPVLIKTDATFVIGMLSSELPKNRGLMRNTRSGPTSIRVGKRKLPRVQRLAVKTRFELKLRGALDMESILPRGSVRFGGIVGFRFLQRLFSAPAENKRTPSPPLHPLVNLLPEAPEVIDR
jgi:hypothetical protein